jgi:hypothetical protein
VDDLIRTFELVDGACRVTVLQSSRAVFGELARGAACAVVGRLLSFCSAAGEQ